MSNQKVVIDNFTGEFGFLSNFHNAAIVVEGKVYPSVEHAYQAYKSLDPDVRETIRKAKNAAIAKKLGRAIQMRQDWENVKYDLMKQFVKKKFENPFLRPLLLATEDAELIEGNTWNDTVWGVCRGRGTNWLGKILMAERDSIRKEEQEELEAQKVNDASQ